ncbi:C39 family peptidase [Ruminococcus sp. HUN007]|uniref:C39 family peptidase n=1 Tax=Ruminococcus sp. HUN007 TaxID=1514668 RepID=UPI000679587B|nr:C39 family peptidase [Ruminococcus sp. HUN007]
MKYRITPFIVAGSLLLGLTSCSAGKNENLFDDEFTNTIVPVELAECYDSPEASIQKLDYNYKTEKAVESSDKTGHRISLNCVMQNPELPTGCEITALTTVLNYMGYNVSKTELAKNYLTTASLGSTGFDKAFIGNPASEDGYGCYAPVIVEAAQKYLIQRTMEITAWDISGTDFNDLFEYIDKDIPVIVWSSMNLMDVQLTDAYYDNNGSSVQWYNNEHCMVICGYDKSDNTVIAADPLKGMMKYNRDRFEMIYNQLEKQAVIIE